MEDTYSERFVSRQHGRHGNTVLNVNVTQPINSGVTDLIFNQEASWHPTKNKFSSRSLGIIKTRLEGPCLYSLHYFGSCEKCLLRMSGTNSRMWSRCWYTVLCEAAWFLSGTIWLRTVYFGHNYSFLSYIYKKIPHFYLFFYVLSLTPYSLH